MVRDGLERGGGGDCVRIPIILMFMFESKSKFSGLRSRWQHFLEWQYCTAESICAKKRFASLSGIFPWAIMKSITFHGVSGNFFKKRGEGERGKGRIGRERGGRKGGKGEGEEKGERRK